MPNRLTQKVVVFIALIWVIYLSRALLLNEWGLDFAVLLASRIGTFIQFLALVFVCGALGLRVLRWINRSITYSLAICYGIGIGFGVLSLYTFFCGILGFLNIEAIALFFVFSSWIGFKEGLGVIQSLRNGFHQIRKRKWDFVSFMLWTILIVAGWVYVLGAFSPVIDYDALEYHVGLPDLYAKAHRIFPMPNHVFSHFPMNIEMLYLVGLALGKPEFIKLFNLVFVVLTGLLIQRYAQGQWGERAGLVAAVLFVCSTHVAMISWMGKSDIGLVFFCTAAVLQFFEGSLGGMLLGGIFSGFALGTKYTAFIYVWGALAVVYFLKMIFEEDRLKSLLGLVLFLAISVLVASPWWVRNFFETGDPIFPLGYPWFKGEIWLSEQYERWSNHYHFLSLRNKMSLWESLTGLIEREKNFWPSAYLGLPLILLCLKDPRVRGLVAYAAVGYILGYHGTVGDPRFLLPIYPCLAIAVGASLVHLKKFLWARRLTTWAIGVFVLWNLGSTVLALEMVKAPQYFFGLIPESGYLREMLPHYRAIEFLNEIMKPGEKVLLMGEARVFYFKRGVLASSVFDRPAIIAFLEGAPDHEEILKRFETQDVSYLLINRAEIQRLDRAAPGWRDGVDEPRLKDFLRECARRIFNDERMGIEIYKIRNLK